MGGTKARMALARVLVVTALMTAVGCVWSTAPAAQAAALTKTPKPTISGFSAVPTIVAGPSGYVHLSAAIAGATSCAFASTTPGTTFTPATVACSTGTVTRTLFVPENYGKKSAKVQIALAAAGPGGTKSAKLTVLVDRGAGGRSVPGAPAGVVATASDGSASVTVTQPASDGGEPVASYTVTAIDLTSASKGGQTASGSIGQLIVTGLVDGHAYRFAATATNLIGTGPSSGYSNQVIPDHVPGTPSGVVAVAGDKQATIAFVPPGNASADTTYRVAATDLTTPANGGQTSSGSTSPVKVSGLTDGDSYTFTVQATNAVGVGPASASSNQVIPESVPGTPTGVVAVAGDQQATIAFVPAGNASAGTMYRVAATDHTTPASGGQSAIGNSPVIVIGLTDGDTYTFAVTAVIGTIEGAASLPSNVVVPTAGSQTPVDQAVEAGQNAYLAALDADPGLAQCNTGTAGSGTCGGIRNGTWQRVNGSDTEYYSFGNPQPTFDPTTHALGHLTV